MSAHSRRLPSRIIHHPATIPVALFLVLLAVLVLSLSYTQRPPFLESITPRIGVPGAVLVLRGSHFGTTRGDGYVVIAGRRLTTSSYLEWEDERISVQIPGDVGSGTVAVANRLGTSDGILFTNKNQIPVVVSQKVTPGVPYIETVSPDNGPIGEPLTITGLNFGLSRGNGKVLFAPIESTSSIETGADKTPEFLSASEIDYDYVSWNDQTIRVHIPDGAVSGNLRVTTDRGTSNAIYLEISGLPGTKILKDRRGYQIFYSIEISDVVAEPSNSLDVWVPDVMPLPEQRNIDYVRVPDPLWQDYLGLSRYHFVNLQPGSTYLINVTAWLERYEVETKIQPSRIPQTYTTDSRLYQTYTAATPEIPADSESIVNAARSVVRRELNPYLRAQAVYLYLLKQLSYDENPPGSTILENLSAAKGDSYTYTFLYCAFLRSLGIPARPVAGFLIYGDKRDMVYYWAEFYVESFGWIPVDLVLGDGTEFENSGPIEDPELYYFGSLDYHHIAFSKGVVEVKAVSPQARYVRKLRSYSLQTIHEEASRSVNSYSSFWSNLQIIDLW